MIKATSLPDFAESETAPKELIQTADVPAVVIEWDRALGAFWTLRLCEYYGVRDARWDYPEVARWDRTSKGGLAYADHPVSKDRSIPGRASVEVNWREEELSFNVTLRNDSASKWEDAWTWICLIQRWAGAFQANCELPAGPADHPWVPCAALRAPKGRWLKWCPVQQHREKAERIARRQAHMWQPHIVATQGAVRAWRMALGEPVQQFIELSSPQAIILGWSHWPCTDMGLYFGSIEPGRSGTVGGTVRFTEEPYEPV